MINRRVNWKSTPNVSNTQYRANQMIRGYIGRNRRPIRPYPSRVGYTSRASIAAARRAGYGKEKKLLDTNLALAGPISTATASNADSFTLNLVQTGSGYFNRVGRKIYMKSLRIKLVANFRSAINTNNIQEASLRCVVVYDERPSGVVPQFDQIFGRTDQTGAETVAVYDPPRPDNLQRFRVVHDCVMTPRSVANNSAATGSYTQNHVYDKYIKLPGLETTYSGDSNPMTIADVSTGALYIFFRQLTQSVNDEIDWSLVSSSMARLRYTD